MNHDRVHARKPSHHVDRWSVGVIESIDERDGHCVVTVRPVSSEEGESEGRSAESERRSAESEGSRSENGPESGPESDGETVGLVVTHAVRDLFVGRLPGDEGESPVGKRAWYRKRGG